MNTVIHKSKSFQPLAGIRDGFIFLRPDVCDTGMNRRFQNLKRKPVDAPWRRAIRPISRPRIIPDEPEAAGADQRSVIRSKRISRDRIRRPAQPQFTKMLSGQKLGSHPLTFMVETNASTVAGPAVSISICSLTSRSVQLWTLNS